VSRSWASREANAPSTRLVIAELLDSQRERLNELFDQTLNVIKDAFGARKIFVVRGVIVDGGPDHYARLEAAKLVLRLVSSRRRRESNSSPAPPRPTKAKRWSPPRRN
jgi:hypothetical protein